MRRLLVGAVLISAVTTTGAQPTRWTVGPKPLTTIDGAGEEFSRVMATRVPSGEIAVLDGVLRELRLYTASGRFVKRLAGPGNGPGEIPPDNLMQVMRSGDTIQLLMSPGMATPSVRHYTASSGFVGSALIRASDAPRGGVSPVAPLGGDRWLARVGTFFEMPMPRAEGESKPVTTVYGIMRLGDGGRYRTLDTLTTMVFASYALPGPGRYTWTATPYASKDIASASGDRIWIGRGTTGRIRILSADGVQLKEIPPVEPLRPFDEARVDAAVKRAISGVDDAARRAMIAAQFSPTGRSTRAPAFTRFLPGVNGEMWVELFREDPRAAAEFRVLDRDGRVIGAVTVPAGVQVENVGTDYVLGIIKDADDVPSVVVYQLGRK